LCPHIEPRPGSAFGCCFVGTLRAPLSTWLSLGYALREVNPVEALGREARYRMRFFDLTLETDGTQNKKRGLVSKLPEEPKNSATTCGHFTYGKRCR
jgi:hypothetical protein